jgi:hypothetical protein
MLRLKKLRRQHDPTSTSATKFVAQRTNERHRRSVGTLDERSRPTAGRRRTGGECVRCTRKTTSEEPDTWTHTNTGGSGASATVLKHVQNWSYDTLEREVRANLVYRSFTRIGDEKVPDAKTLARLGQVVATRGELLQAREALQKLGIEPTVQHQRGSRGVDLDRQEQVESVKRWYNGDWKNLDRKLQSSKVEGISVFLSLFDDTGQVRVTQMNRSGRKRRSSSANRKVCSSSVLSKRKNSCNGRRR